MQGGPSQQAWTPTFPTEGWAWACSPQMEEFRLAGSSHSSLPAGEWGLGGRVGCVQPPLHLAAGSWDTGQGPICYRHCCQHPAGRAGVWPGSSEAK